jgi:hypothetical protein
MFFGDNNFSFVYKSGNDLTVVVDKWNGTEFGIIYLPFTC